MTDGSKDNFQTLYGDTMMSNPDQLQQSNKAVVDNLRKTYLSFGKFADKPQSWAKSTYTKDNTVAGPAVPAETAKYLRKSNFVMGNSTP